MNWGANPYVIAQSFFRPRLHPRELSAREVEILGSIVSRIKGAYLVSSSNGSHFEAIERIAKDSDLGKCIPQVDLMEANPPALRASPPFRYKANGLSRGSTPLVYSSVCGNFTLEIVTYSIRHENGSSSQLNKAVGKLRRS